MNKLPLVVLTLVSVSVCVLSGCSPGPKSSIGFTLPDGDAEQGKKTFVDLQCHACHTIEGMNFEKLETVTNDPMVRLGGETTYVRTYGNLVTSIINPSHRFALGYPSEEIKDGDDSKMRLYNDEMTITELSDLVTFLQQHYEVRTYHPTPYAPYY